MSKRVLVPLDGSAVAETVLPFILEFAKLLDMEVILLRVRSAAYALSDLHLPDIGPRWGDEDEYLGPLAQKLRRDGIRIEAQVPLGIASEEIVTAARATGADFIATSTHGRSGVRRLVLGSVTEAVLRHADIPVFAIRAGQTQVARSTDQADTE